MKRTGIILIAWALCLCMLGGSAAAQTLPLHALEDYLPQGGVRFSMGMKADVLLPFEQERLDMINRLLAHVDVTAEVDSDVTVLSLALGGTPVLEATERTVEDGTQLTTPQLENRILHSSGSALDALTGEVQQQPAFDLPAAMIEAEGCYRALTDAILPFAEEKKANYKIKSVGTSKWSRVARLTTEQSAQLGPMIEALLGCGMDDAFRTQIAGMTYSKGFIVALYKTAQDGDDLAVYIKGDVTLADGTAYKLTYQWAFAQDGDERIDTYKLDWTKKKTPANNRVIQGKYQRATGDRFAVDGSWTCTLKTSQGTVATTVDHDLTGKAASDGVRTFAGECSTTVKTTSKGKTVTTVQTIKPDCTLTPDDGGSVLSGSVVIQNKNGKKVEGGLTLTFAPQPLRDIAAAAPAAASDSYNPLPDSSLAQNVGVFGNAFLVGAPPIGYVDYDAPAQMQSFDLDSATPDQLAMLTDELAQNVAGHLLAALGAVPAEDLALFGQNMTDEDFSRFIDLVQSL